MLENLGAVWANYRRAGPPQYLVLARVVEERAELEGYRLAVPEADMLVVRVVASERTIEARLRAREVGSYFERLWRRSRELAGVLEMAGPRTSGFQTTGGRCGRWRLR